MLPSKLTTNAHARRWLLTVFALLALTACQPAATAGTDPWPTLRATATIPIAAIAPPAHPGPTATAQPGPTLTVSSTPTTVAISTPIQTLIPAPTSAAAASAPIPVYGYRVVKIYPHDPLAFTQGLVYQDGVFFEGTGLRGRSSLRKVDPASGLELQGIALPDEYFGEGLAVLGDRLYQLSWQENTGFIYDKDSFELLDTWAYAGEGWGLTTDGERLIMSDGTSALRFLDPNTLEETGRVEVTYGGEPVQRLNELEWIDGEVWANIWQTDRIARIDPASGRLLGWIDLTGLLSAEDRAAQPVDVLNGIAYDAATGRVFVTGKWWPKLFAIELIEATP